MSFIHPAGLFQGQAPQFIILSVSMGFYIYTQHFKWDYYLPKSRSMDNPAYGQLGIEQGDMNGKPDKKIRNFIWLLFFGNLFIIFRILLSNIIQDHQNLNIFYNIDGIIVFYFIIALFFPFIVFKNIYQKSKEAPLEFVRKYPDLLSSKKPLSKNIAHIPAMKMGPTCRPKCPMLNNIN